MTFERPYYTASRITVAVFIGLFIFDKAWPGKFGFGGHFAIFTLVMAFLALSHFREKRLPYFYPTLFMYSLILLLAIAALNNWV